MPDFDHYMIYVVSGPNKVGFAITINTANSIHPIEQDFFSKLEEAGLEYKASTNTHGDPPKNG